MSYQTGATFYPGGDDSYYMPEIVQPSPHRANEHPTNIPQNVAQMEQAARTRDPSYGMNHKGSPQLNANRWDPITPPGNPWEQNLDVENSKTPPYTTSSYTEAAFGSLPDQPNFSPFPSVRNPPPNVPPTDDQKEVTLEAARDAVLGSNDPETQLVWAQDALSYVEIAQQNEQRISTTQPPRSRTPQIEHVLREDAMKVVNFLADQHHPKAEFMRGMWLEFGKFNHRIDKKEAFMCYSRAVEKGYARADYRIGMQFESSNEPLKAIKYYQRGVDVGDSASCYRLGMMTLLGQHGQMQDYERAVNLIQLAAQTADENAPQGAYVLGMLQAQEMPQIKIPDRFLQRDLLSAKINIEKAAYLGFAKAQVKMGSAYELCELGCEFNPTLSLHYNALAARQGEPEAEMAISKWFLCGQEGVFEKSEEIAFIYAQRAAVGGFATAQFAMGYFYEVGIYVPVDFQVAKEWYRKASQNGNQDAPSRIDAISRSKTLSRKDHENIALSKIRKQYGSQNHEIPPVPTLPNLPPAVPLDMPDPSRLNLTSPPLRPGSAAPYPTGPANTGPDFRPSSAFGINPNLRPNSATASAGYRPNSYSPNYGSQSVQPRPYSSTDPRSSRIPSGPQPGQIPMQQGRPPMRPGSTSPYLHPQDVRKNSPSPNVDIGYTAPPDLTGADRKQRLPYQNNSYTSKPQPGPPGPMGNSSKPLPNPNLQSQQAGTPNSRYYGSANSSNSRPSKSQPDQKMQAAQIKPSKLPANAPTSSGTRPKPVAVAPNVAKPRPDGKGPKTFEDMGVPNSKDKEECIVM